MRLPYMVSGSNDTVSSLPCMHSFSLFLLSKDLVVLVLGVEASTVCDLALLGAVGASSTRLESHCSPLLVMPGWTPGMHVPIVSCTCTPSMCPVFLALVYNVLHLIPLDLLKSILNLPSLLLPSDVLLNRPSETPARSWYPDPVWVWVH